MRSLAASHWSASDGGGWSPAPSASTATGKAPALITSGLFSFLNMGFSMIDLAEAVQELELAGAEGSNLDDLPDGEYDQDTDRSPFGGHDAH